MTMHEAQIRAQMDDMQKTLKRLYDLYKHDRAAYKIAVAYTVRLKGPGMTYQQRRRFVAFALDVFDEAVRRGA